MAVFLPTVALRRFAVHDAGAKRCRLAFSFEQHVRVCLTLRYIFARNCKRMEICSLFLLKNIFFGDIVALIRTLCY